MELRDEICAIHVMMSIHACLKVQDVLVDPVAPHSSVLQAPLAEREEDYRDEDEDKAFEYCFPRLSHLHWYMYHSQSLNAEIFRVCSLFHSVFPKAEIASVS